MAKDTNSYKLKKHNRKGRQNMKITYKLSENEIKIMVKMIIYRLQHDDIDSLQCEKLNNVKNRLSACSYDYIASEKGKYTYHHNIENVQNIELELSDDHIDEIVTSIEYVIENTEISSSSIDVLKELIGLITMQQYRDINE